MYTNFYCIAPTFADLFYCLATEAWPTIIIGQIDSTGTFVYTVNFNEGSDCTNVFCSGASTQMETD